MAPCWYYYKNISLILYHIWIYIGQIFIVCSTEFLFNLCFYCFEFIPSFLLKSRLKVSHVLCHIDLNYSDQLLLDLVVTRTVSIHAVAKRSICEPYHQWWAVLLQNVAALFLPLYAWNHSDAAATAAIFKKIAALPGTATAKM